MDQEPTFIVAGAMRCGTTSLNAYLREHPQIAMSQPKEVHFFDVHFAKGCDWYRSHFPGAHSAKAIGEATPEYLYAPEAIPRIAATVPEVKILLMLRDPVDRAYSHYWHNRSRGHEQLAFEAALDEEPHRLAKGPEARSTFSYVDKGRYREQIERVFDHFPAEQVLIQTFEELVESPELVFGRTCRFLGVADDFRPPSLGRSINAYVEFRSTRIRHVARHLPPPLRRLVGKLNEKPAAAYPPMRPETRLRLDAAFGAANDGLTDLIGRDSPAWE